MVIFYTIVKLICFPGSLVKGFLEHLFYRIFKVPVEFSDYLEKNELCGHCEHLLADRHSFAVCWWPHIIMMLLGTAIAFPSSINLFYLGSFDWISLILLYVGITFLVSGFPLMEDVYKMWADLRSSKTKKSTKILLAVPAGILYAGAAVEKTGFSILTSLAYTVVLPYVVAFVIG